MIRPFMLKIVLVCSVLTTGCPQYRDASVPNRIERQTDPYYLYTPSTYDRKYRWPLVILCHGTRPWDHAKRQMRDWVKLAEEERFIVAAPDLCGTSSFPTPSLSKQVARQLEDERRILNTVRHIRAAYNISEDRIFMTGWSAGSFAVLYTGLRHPEVFRALAIQQGNFDPTFLSDLIGHIDPHQPIGVIAGAADILAGGESRQCIDWLSEQQANVFEFEVFGGHRGHPTRAQEFFDRVLRKMPWLRIRTYAAKGVDPLSVQFKSRASFQPATFRWLFGDGAESPVAEPVHSYVEPGTYQVKLTATTPDGKSLNREMALEVPVFQGLELERTEWDDPSS